SGASRRRSRTRGRTRLPLLRPWHARPPRIHARSRASRSSAAPCRAPGRASACAPRCLPLGPGRPAPASPIRPRAPISPSPLSPHTSLEIGLLETGTDGLGEPGELSRVHPGQRPALARVQLETSLGELSKCVDRIPAESTTQGLVGGQQTDDSFDVHLAHG